MVARWDQCKVVLLKSGFFPVDIEILERLQMDILSTIGCKWAIVPAKNPLSICLRVVEGEPV